MDRNRKTFYQNASRNGYDICSKLYTDFGKKLILSREREFASLMVIFGQIKLLQIISFKLNFSMNAEIQKLKDKFFH